MLTTGERLILWNQFAIMYALRFQHEPECKADIATVLGTAHQELQSFLDVDAKAQRKKEQRKKAAKILKRASERDM